MDVTLPEDFIAPSTNQTGLTNKQFLTYLEVLSLVKTQKENSLISDIILLVPGLEEFVRDIFIAATNNEFNYDVEKSPYRSLIYNTIAKDPSSAHWLRTYGLRLLFDILPKQTKTEKFKVKAVNPYSKSKFDWCETKKTSDKSRLQRGEDTEEEETEEEDENRLQCKRHEQANERDWADNASDTTTSKGNSHECPYCDYSTQSGHLKRHIMSKHKDALMNRN